MKPHLCLILLVTTAALGQSIPPRPALGGIPTGTVTLSNSSVTDAPKLTKFNLDFPGGNPKQLVAAIEKATGRPLNVVIPEEYSNESLPALRMTQVTVSDLFMAMAAASPKSELYRPPGVVGSYSYNQTSISFQTIGLASDDSIWYFRGRQKTPDFSTLDIKPVPAKTSRFYALTPYLEQGLKVEDITTAIQTGWKMLGEKETPSISFHKETKLLIAVGEPGKLETIDAVLKALTQKSAIDPATGLPIDPYARMTEIERRAAVPASAAKSPALPKPAPSSVNEP
jgi:hypothetical protein